MAKTIFEQMGGTYTMQGDYCLPNLTLLAKEERPIGVWAQRRLRYLKQHHNLARLSLRLVVGQISAEVFCCDLFCGLPDRGKHRLNRFTVVFQGFFGTALDSLRCDECFDHIWFVWLVL